MLLLFPFRDFSDETDQCLPQSLSPLIYYPPTGQSALIKTQSWSCHQSAAQRLKPGFLGLTSMYVLQPLACKYYVTPIHISRSFSYHTLPSYFPNLKPKYLSLTPMASQFSKLDLKSHRISKTLFMPFLVLECPLTSVLDSFFKALLQRHLLWEAFILKLKRRINHSLFGTPMTMYHEHLSIRVVAYWRGESILPLSDGCQHQAQCLLPRKGMVTIPQKDALSTENIQITWGIWRAGWVDLWFPGLIAWDKL